jgi:hypothetical protein
VAQAMPVQIRPSAPINFSLSKIRSWRNWQTRWAQNSVSSDIPVRVRGNGPVFLTSCNCSRGRSGKGKRDPKT